MSNPTLAHGPITFKVGEENLERYRLVKLETDGTVTYADASGPVFGAVTERGAKTVEFYGAPDVIAVHTAPASVPVEATEAITDYGATVYAAADGKVAKTGTVAVGVVVGTNDGAGNVPIIRLVTPTVAAS